MNSSAVTATTGPGENVWPSGCTNCMPAAETVSFHVPGGAAPPAGIVVLYVPRKGEPSSETPDDPDGDDGLVDAPLDAVEALGSTTDALGAATEADGDPGWEHPAASSPLTMTTSPVRRTFIFASCDASAPVVGATILPRVFRSCPRARRVGPPAAMRK